MVVLDIPARSEYVAIVRQVISIIAGRAEILSVSRVDDLILAVSEACSNAIASYGPYEFDEEAHIEIGTSPRVAVRVSEDEAQLVIEVEDSGIGFDPKKIPDRSIHSDFHPSRVRRPYRAESGRGVQLIRALVDEANFVSSQSGTTVTMTMQLAQASLGTAL